MKDRHLLYEGFKTWCEDNPKVTCCICGEPCHSFESVDVPMQGGDRAHADCYDAMYG